MAGLTQEEIDSLEAQLASLEQVYTDAGTPRGDVYALIRLNSAIDSTASAAILADAKARLISGANALVTEVTNLSL